MSARLPEDILAEILKQLPAKSLLQFRSVLRSWNSLITSGWFITLHLNRPAESTESWMLLGQYLPTRMLLIKTAYGGNGKSFTEGQELEFPTKTSHNYRYVGACNGLLCFYHIDYLKVVLWNPSIRTCFQVPIRRTVQVPHYFVGFGFDCRTSQYKVVVTISNVVGKNYRSQFLPQVKVFVLGTDKCRRVDIGVPFLILSFQAFHHGAIHWIAYMPYRSRVVLIFDVQEEGDLRMARGGVPSFLFIWVMKQYGAKESWTKQFSINMRDQGGLRMLGFRKRDKILFVNGKRELVSYEPKSGRVEQLGLEPLGKPVMAVPFMESLAGLP